MKPLRVLVTGANGLVGQRLVADLAGRPSLEITASGRQPLPRFPASICPYVELDLEKPAAIRSVLAEVEPRVVVHAAALSQVDHCEDRRDECWRVNVESTREICRIVAETGGRVVLVSSDFVFDGASGPYGEDSVPAPLSFYGESKVAAEEAVRTSGLRSWAIVRTVLVYGAARQLARTNIATWVIDSLRSGKRIQVVRDQWRTPTYVGDLASGLSRLLERQDAQVWHVSGRDLMSVVDFARAVAAAFSLDASLIDGVATSELAQRGKRPARTGFIIEKAERALDFRPRGVREGLALLRADLQALEGEASAAPVR